MWISAQRQRSRGSAAVLGTVTLAGNPAGVYADGERRDLPVLAPGGYRWKPRVGDQVLVLKTEDGTPCLVGGIEMGDGLLPGEVAIVADIGGAGIRLKRDGTVEITGQLKINGVPFGGI